MTVQAFWGKNDHVPVQTKRHQKKVKNEKKKREGKIKFKKIEFSALAVRPTVGFMREGGQRDNKKYTSVQLAKRRMGHIPVPVPFMMLSIRM